MPEIKQLQKYPSYTHMRLLSLKITWRFINIVIKDMESNKRRSQKRKKMENNQTEEGIFWEGQIAPLVLKR